MSKNVLLIPESYVLERSAIESNVDTSIITKLIVNLQEVQLKDILGPTLYDSLIDAVYDSVQSGSTLSDTYKTLLTDYIQPYLLQAVVADFMMVNNYKITNKGVLKLSDNVGSNLSTQELEYAKNYYDNYAAALKQRLIDYVKKDKLSDKNDVVTPNAVSDAIGWYLN